MTDLANTTPGRACVRVLDVLRSRALPGEPELLTVTRAVRGYRREAAEADRLGKPRPVGDKASARVSGVAHVLKSYLVKISEDTSIAWALALLEVPGAVLKPDEGDGSVAVLTARHPDWSAAEVERVAKRYARDLRGGWPELAYVLDALRAQRMQFVGRVRQDLTRLALPAKTEPGAYEDERAEAARVEAMAAVRACFAKLGVGR